MSKGIIVSPANRGVQVVVTDENNVQLLIDSNRGVNLEVVPQPRIDLLVDKAVAGPQGPQGPQGTAATIAVGTTTTGAAGTNASVVNTGTSSAAVFDFTIPRGDTGAAGATGAGVAVGGTTGQFLQKASNANYDTTWSTITGTLVYQGSWNAATNTPALASSVGTNGYYYVVGTSGSTNLNGITDWVVGDWAIFNGSIWQKIDNTDLVSSVNGQTGVVVLDAADVGALAIANNLSDLANAGTSRTNLGLGTIATQDANTVAITGGTINNTVIGSTTPAAGTFTTLTATGQTSLGGVAGSESFRATVVASSVNWIQAEGAITGQGVFFKTQGADSGVNFFYQTKGSATHRFYTNSGLEQFRIAATASAVNYVQVTGAATGGSVQITTQGSDTNIGVIYGNKGVGSHSFRTQGTTSIQFQVTHTTNAVNRLEVTGGASGVAPVLSVTGTDTNIDLTLTPKGTGNVRFGTHTSLASTTFSIGGYIEIKDSSGTLRKLAVIL